MLGFISGEVIHQQKPVLIIKAGHVGYTVQFSDKNFEMLSQQSNPFVEVAVHTRFMADQIQLFGFLNFADKQLFELLISVNGCGPKVALSLIDTMNCTDLLYAVEHNNPSTLYACPGLGRTTAAKLLAGLNSPKKIATLCSIQTKPAVRTNSITQELEMALLNLGFSRQQIQPALLQENTQQGFEVCLQNCLKRLDTKK